MSADNIRPGYIHLGGNRWVKTEKVVSVMPDVRDGSACSTVQADSRSGLVNYQCDYLPHDVIGMLVNSASDWLVRAEQAMSGRPMPVPKPEVTQDSESQFKYLGER